MRPSAESGRGGGRALPRRSKKLSEVNPDMPSVRIDRDRRQDALLRRRQGLRGRREQGRAFSTWLRPSPKAPMTLSCDERWRS